MEKYLLPLLEQGGPLGALVVFAVLFGGYALRQKGWLFGDPSKVVSNSQISELSGKVDAMDRRLSHLESELEHLPSREEFHEMQLNQVRMSAQIDALNATVVATNRGVGRIEDFMIKVAGKE